MPSISFNLFWYSSIKFLFILLRNTKLFTFSRVYILKFILRCKKVRTLLCTNPIRWKIIPTFSLVWVEKLIFMNMNITFLYFFIAIDRLLSQSDALWGVPIIHPPKLWLRVLSAPRHRNFIFLISWGWLHGEILGQERCVFYAKSRTSWVCGLK